MSERERATTKAPNEMAVSAVPDGGWGWVVVAAVALINITNQSLLSVFGLLFGAELLEMGHDTSLVALVTNLNSLALNFSGFFIGPAIKCYQPRPVAAVGCLLVSAGLIVCALASQTWHFVAGYSVLVGIGLGLIAPSTFMAINGYFCKKRGRAVGVSLAGAGLGQVFLPHLVRVLLERGGFRCTVLVMAVFALSGLFGALLLRPPPSLVSPAGHPPPPSSPPRLQPFNNRQHIQPLLLPPADNEKAGYQIKIMPAAPASRPQTTTIGLLLGHKAAPAARSGPQKLCHKLRERLVQAMDLELLGDPIFWSLIVGMALVYTSTLQFTMLFPNFLIYSVGVTRSHTATCMSIMAGADIICRVLLPFITDHLRIPYRWVFLLGTLGLLLARTALAESLSLPSLVVMCIFTGIAKSATVINNNLTITAHCRLEKLPGGLGLNMIAKAVLVISVGQLLAFIRDYSGSYVVCLHAQNALLLAVVVVWTPEITWNWWRRRRSHEQELKSGGVDGDDEVDGREEAEEEEVRATMGDGTTKCSPHRLPPPVSGKGSSS